MNFSEFKNNVEKWQEEKGIYEHSTALAQALKAVSEAGELADAVIKDDRDALKDAIGDVVVCIVGVAKLTGCGIEARPLNDVPKNNQVLASLVAYYVADIASDIALDTDPDPWSVKHGIERSIIYLSHLAIYNNLSLLECCESAWNEIKDRKGRVVAGGAFVKDE